MLARQFFGTSSIALLPKPQCLIQKLSMLYIEVLALEISRER
jgi:hypothetical protein